MALKHGACFGELLKDAPLIYFPVLTGRSVPARRFFMTFGGGLANGPSVRSKPAYSFRHFSYSAGSTPATRSASAMGLPSVASASITRSLSRISLGLSFRLATWRAPRDSGERSASPPGALPRHRHPKPPAGAAEVSRVGGRDRLSRRRQAASARPRWRDHQAGDRRRGHRKPGGLRQVAREGERHDAFVT